MQCQSLLAPATVEVNSVIAVDASGISKVSFHRVIVFDVTTYAPVHGSGNADIIIEDSIMYIAISSLSFVECVLCFCTGLYVCCLLFASSNQT